MVAEGIIPIEVRSGHRLASVSVTGDFSDKLHLVFPERASIGRKNEAHRYRVLMGMKPAAAVY